MGIERSGIILRGREFEIKMKESVLLQLYKEYQRKFISCLKMADMYEGNDNEKFMEMVKKASGYKLMMDGAKRELNDFK